MGSDDGSAMGGSSFRFAKVQDTAAPKPRQRIVLQKLFTTDHLEQGRLYVQLRLEGWMDPRMVVRLRTALEDGLDGLDVADLHIGSYEPPSKP